MDNSATGEPAPSRLSWMLRALSHRNYRLFFGGQAVSLAGTWMTQIAMTWLVYRLTGSAWMLGLVGFAGQIPAFCWGQSPESGLTVCPNTVCSSSPRHWRCCNRSSWRCSRSTI